VRKEKGRTYTPLLKVGVPCEKMCEILRCKIKNSFHSC